MQRLALRRLCAAARSPLPTARPTRSRCNQSERLAGCGAPSKLCIGTRATYWHAAARQIIGRRRRLRKASRLCVGRRRAQTEPIACGPLGRLWFRRGVPCGGGGGCNEIDFVEAARRGELSSGAGRCRRRRRAEKRPQRATPLDRWRRRPSQAPAPAAFADVGERERARVRMRRRGTRTRFAGPNVASDEPEMTLWKSSARRRRLKGAHVI